VDRRQLHKRAQQTARELNLSSPLNIDELRDRLGTRMGRPILFAPMPLLRTHSVYGLLWDDPARDAIVLAYEQNASPAHQAAIQLHELSHKILDHPSQGVDHSYQAQLGRRLEGLTPDKVAEALGEALGDKPPRLRLPGWPRKRDRARSERQSAPTLYDNAFEWEAEMMATILLSWVDGYGGHITPTPTSPAAAVLGDRTPW
jgi:hypothetical protein